MSWHDELITFEGAHTERRREMLPSTIHIPRSNRVKATARHTATLFLFHGSGEILGFFFGLPCAHTGSYAYNLSLSENYWQWLLLYFYLALINASSVLLCTFSLPPASLALSLSDGVFVMRFVRARCFARVGLSLSCDALPAMMSIEKEAPARTLSNGWISLTGTSWNFLTLKSFTRPLRSSLTLRMGEW